MKPNNCILILCCLLWGTYLIGKDSLPLEGSIGRRCFIKVNTQDCIACLASISQLSEIDTTLKVYFVFKESLADDSVNVFQSFNRNGQQKVIFNDSLYYGMNTFKESYVSLIKSNDSVYCEFPLKRLSQNIHLINIGDSLRFNVKLPDNFQPKLVGNRLYCFSYERNEIEVFNVQYPNKSPWRIKLGKQADSIGFAKHFNNRERYLYTKQMLSSMNVPGFMKQNKILCFDVLDDTLYVLSQLYFPQRCLYKEKIDTCFMQMYTVYKFHNNILAGVYPVRNIIPDSLLSIYNTDYELAASANLNIEYDGFYTQVIRELKGGKNEFMGHWTFTGEEFVFDDFSHINLSKLIYKYSFEYEFADYILKSEFLIQCFSNELININSKDKIVLKFKDMNGLAIRSNNEDVEHSIRFNIIDFMVSMNAFHVLFKHKGIIYCASFNSKTGDLMSQKELFIVDVSKPQFRANLFFLKEDLVGYFPVRYNGIKTLRITKTEGSK